MTQMERKEEHEDPPGQSPPHLWEDSSRERWNDRLWQLFCCLNTVEDFARVIHLTPKEVGDFWVPGLFRVDVSPHFATLGGQLWGTESEMGFWAFSFSLEGTVRADCPPLKPVTPTGLDGSTCTIRLKIIPPVTEAKMAGDTQSPVPGLVYHCLDGVLMPGPTQRTSPRRSYTHGHMVGNPPARFSSADHVTEAVR